MCVQFWSSWSSCRTLNILFSFDCFCVFNYTTSFFLIIFSFLWCFPRWEHANGMNINVLHCQVTDLFFNFQFCPFLLGGDSDLKAQEPQDLHPLHLSHGLHECKECDQVFPDAQRQVTTQMYRFASSRLFSQRGAAGAVYDVTEIFV